MKTNKHKFKSPKDWQAFKKYLCEENRYAMSDYWEKFIQAILETSNKRKHILKKGSRLFRARIGIDWYEFNDGDEQPFPLSPHQMGAPPRHLAREGRLNSKGIPCLYLASDIDTAVAEIRPWISSSISIGYFNTLEEITVIDTSKDLQKSPPHFSIIKDDNGEILLTERPDKDYSDAEIEQNIWGDINFSFSKPVSRDDTFFSYLPTQFVSEKFKMYGYDGVAYKSSLNQTGFNIALFNPRKAKCYKCRGFDLKKITYIYEECCNPISLSSDDKVLYPRIDFVGPTTSTGSKKSLSKTT